MTSSDQEDDVLIDPDDFRGIKTTVNLRNITTQTEVRNLKNERKPKNSKGPVAYKIDYEVTIMEFLEQGLILDCPPRSCAQGHQVLLHIFAKTPKRELELELSTVVEEVEILPEKNCRVTVHIQEFEESSWSSLTSLFEERQNDILEFFMAAKG